VRRGATPIHTDSDPGLHKDQVATYLGGVGQAIKSGEPGDRQKQQEPNVDGGNVRCIDSSPDVSAEVPAVRGDVAIGGWYFELIFEARDRYVLRRVGGRSVRPVPFSYQEASRKSLEPWPRIRRR
jgi:hypothetical protein